MSSDIISPTPGPRRAVPSDFTQVNEPISVGSQLTSVPPDPSTVGSIGVVNAPSFDVATPQQQSAFFMDSSPMPVIMNQLQQLIHYLRSKSKNRALSERKVSEFAAKLVDAYETTAAQQEKQIVQQAAEKINMAIDRIYSYYVDVTPLGRNQPFPEFAEFLGFSEVMIQGVVLLAQGMMQHQCSPVPDNFRLVSNANETCQPNPFALLTRSLNKVTSIQQLQRLFSDRDFMSVLLGVAANDPVLVEDSVTGNNSTVTRSESIVRSLFLVDEKSAEDSHLSDLQNARRLMTQDVASLRSRKSGQVGAKVSGQIEDLASAFEAELQLVDQDIQASQTRLAIINQVTTQIPGILKKVFLPARMTMDQLNSNVAQAFKTLDDLSIGGPIAETQDEYYKNWNEDWKLKEFRSRPIPEEEQQQHQQMQPEPLATSAPAARRRRQNRRSRRQKH